MPSSPAPTAAARRRERIAAGFALCAASAGLLVFVAGPAPPPPASDVTSWMPATVPALRWDRLYLSRAIVEVSRPALLVLLVATRPGRRLLRRTTGWMSSSVVGAALASVNVLVAVDLLTAPVSWWGRLRTDDVVGWLAEWFVTRAQTWALVGLLAAGLTIAIRRWPGSWRWRSVLVGTALALVIPLGADLDPLAGELRALPEGPVRNAVEAAASEAGAGDVSLRVGDGAAASELGAYVSGIGPSRSIVFSSVLVDRFPPDEVAFVAMHEFAHREYLDVYRTVLGTAAGLVVGLWILGGVLEWPAVLRQVGEARAPEVRRMVVALAVVVVMHTLATPVANLASRRSEAAADWRALELTGDPDPAIRIQRSILENGGADPSPPGWYQAWLATHPSAGERIGLAVRYARLHGIDIGP